MVVGTELGYFYEGNVPETVVFVPEHRVFMSGDEFKIDDTKFYMSGWARKAHDFQVLLLISNSCFLFTPSRSTTRMMLGSKLCFFVWVTRTHFLLRMRIFEKKALLDLCLSRRSLRALRNLFDYGQELCHRKRLSEKGAGAE